MVYLILGIGFTLAIVAMTVNLWRNSNRNDSMRKKLNEFMEGVVEGGRGICDCL